MNKNERAKKVVDILTNKYPNAETELVWDKKYPYQLMVAVMLSAQATDVGVNKVTKTMFKKYKTPKDFAESSYEDLVKYTKSINYYKTKTERILNNAKQLLEDFGGEIPKTVKELITLPGVGRKSANVILQEIYGIGEGVVVDTHMTRVTNRLKLQPYNNQKDAEKIEQKLMNVVEKNKFTEFSRTIVLHGRYTCKARNPMCDKCELNQVCPSAFSF
jgi:endonuclease-3